MKGPSLPFFMLMRWIEIGREPPVFWLQIGLPCAVRGTCMGGGRRRRLASLGQALWLTWSRRRSLNEVEVVWHCGSIASAQGLWSVGSLALPFLERKRPPYPCQCLCLLPFWKIYFEKVTRRELGKLNECITPSNNLARRFSWDEIMSRSSRL